MKSFVKEREAQELRPKWQHSHKYDIIYECESGCVCYPKFASDTVALLAVITVFYPEAVV